MTGRGYIGGGHIAAILGISPYQTPLDAYCEITGDMPRAMADQKEAEQQEFFWRRRALEPFANACFERQTGLKIVCENRRYDDKEFPWAKAEIDAEFDDPISGERCNIETKTARVEVRDQWGDPRLDEEPPPYITVQGMWGLGVTGRHIVYVHGLIGLDESRIYRIERQDDLIAISRERAAWFWNHHVVPRRPPLPVSEGDLKRLFPRDSGRSVEVTDAVQEEYRRALIAASRLRIAEVDYAKHTLALKMHMRDATTLTYKGKPLARWKADSRGVRTFRLT